MPDAPLRMPSLLRSSSGGPPGSEAVVGVLFLAAVVFLACVGFAALAMGNIRADQLGVLINNATGTVTIVQPGTCFYNSIISDLYVIDRKQQTVEMRRTKRRGIPDEEEDASDEVGAVKIKTVDGSDVSADIIINYIIQPEKAAAIVENSGPGDAYERKWGHDYARSICRNVLGELTTEEFYNSVKRDEKARQSLVELNKALNPWGLDVTSVQVQDFGFYHEYEEKIREKKLADQEVEEQKSQAKAAVEKQKRVRIEVESRMTVQIAQFKGDMEKRRVEAEAQANKGKLGADAYAYTTKIGAEANYYQCQKQAEGILATRTAQANGLQQLAHALQGGQNLVLLEYANRLKSMRLTGQPVVYDPRMERFQHFGAAASGQQDRAEGGATTAAGLGQEGARAAQGAAVARPDGGGGSGEPPAAAVEEPVAPTTPPTTQPGPFPAPAPLQGGAAQ